MNSFLGTEPPPLPIHPGAKFYNAAKAKEIFFRAAVINTYYFVANCINYMDLEHRSKPKINGLSSQLQFLQKPFSHFLFRACQFPAILEGRKGKRGKKHPCKHVVSRISKFSGPSERKKRKGKDLPIGSTTHSRKK